MSVKKCIDCTKLLFGGKQCGHTASVDRIIPALGYTKNNIAVISRRANVIKNDASLEELNRVVTWLLNTNACGHGGSGLSETVSETVVGEAGISSAHF